MNILPLDKRVRILSALVEGNSLRAISRMVGVSINTVMKFVAAMGPVCEAYHDAYVRNVASKRIQADEIWAFCYAKDKNLPASMRGMPGVGSVWTWTAIDADSKLMVAWMVGDRDAECAGRFMLDLSHRLAGRCQLTTDGHKVYERAVQDAFGWQIDYAMLVKLYGEPRDGEARYSPCECIGTRTIRISGRPESAHISTSFAERANLTMRMGMRRFTRLTNGFSKKVANHRAAVAIHFMHYNFCRIHTTIRVTPAMEAKLADHVWELEELVGLMEARERALIGTEANKRGPYGPHHFQTETLPAPGVSEVRLTKPRSRVARGVVPFCMPTIHTLTPPGTPTPIGPYSHIAKVGQWITIGGTAGVDPATGQLAGPDIAAQTRQILASFRTMLESVGSDLAHIVHVNIFLLDMADFEPMNRAYIEALGNHRPARTTIGVASLPKSGARITMSLTAVTR